MRTVTLDILNDDTIKLLKNLEVLNLIRFRKDNAEFVGDKISLSEFSFSKSREILKDYKGSLSDSIVEERRSEV